MSDQARERAEARIEELRELAKSFPRLARAFNDTANYLAALLAEKERLEQALRAIEELAAEESTEIGWHAIRGIASRALAGDAADTEETT